MQFVKPISSAIASSQLSLNAQPDAQNPLQLNVPIPPPTKESREQSITYAKSEMDRASMNVKIARQDLNKKLKHAGKISGLRPDDLHAGLKEMENIVQKAQKEIQAIFESTKKVLERA
jgi:ribosome recycling factor